MATPLASDNYQLKWHSFGAHLHTSVATLFQSDCYTDTILCTYDGHQMKAHRFILSLCSVYFQNIFKHHVKSISSLPLIVIMPPDIDIKTLKTLIQYIYCGETTVSNEILEHVLKAGEALKIRGLWRPTDSESPPPMPVHKPEPIAQPTPPPPAKKPMPSMKKIVLPSDKIPVSNNLMPPVITSSNSSDVPGIKIENIRTQDDNDPVANLENNTVPCLKIDLKKTESVQLTKSPASPVENNIPELKIRSTSDVAVLDKSKPTKTIALTSKETANDPKRFRTVIKSIHTLNAEKADELNEKQSVSSIPDENIDEPDKYIVIKEEPIEWDQLDDVELSENELFQTEMTIKPEIIFPNDDDDEYQMHIDEEKEENYYSPLTCELCSETFTLPAEWVRHIEGHSDLHQPAKRQRRGRSTAEEGSSKLPPLVCDLCQKLLPTPAEWVRHIQTTHTERELAASNNSNPPKSKQIRAFTGHLKICNICNKRFPSHASMVIHARTHTGERPFLCTLCNKGFNVKSNLLRHLRTLHDKIISSTEVTDKQEVSQ